MISRLRIAVTGLLVLGCFEPCQATKIARDGQAEAVIVVAEGASEPVRHAATELARFLKQITGADFEIVSSIDTAKHRILVGPEAVRMIRPGFSTKGLGREGIVIRSLGKDLILAGGEPRGTLYAVYTFLEDHCGCRWWSSTASTIPSKPTLNASKLRIRYVPPLEYRSPFWFDAFDGDWAARNKCNGQSHRLGPEHGGRHIYEGHVHTFYRLIPPARYFEDHPEWFSMIDGRRTHDRTQLCLTNEEMRTELVRNLKTNLRNNPAATIASVSQNDWHGNCQCPKCAAIESEEGSPAGLMLRFVNSVAKEIEQEFPDLAISTLAYQYTRRPPKITKPRDNVIVRLCSIECSFSAPLAHERNKAFRDDIVGWSKICDRVYIWDYTTNFRHHIMPHPNLRVLGPNVRFFVDHNAKGIFEQGAYTTNGAEMAELRAWVLAKLLWDPTRDGQQLIDEFVQGYYGPAAPHIKAYIQTMHEAVEQSEDWLGCFSGHKARFLSFETLSKGWRQLQAAGIAVKNHPQYELEVKVAQLPIMYTFMIRWDEMRRAAKQANADWPLDESIEKVFEDFMAVARRKNITRLNEHKPGFDILADAVKRASK